MAEKWRVCELAGGAVGNVRACRLPAYVIVAHPSEYRYARCHVGGADGGHSKTYKLKPECDDCPIPAQLDALDKARIHCGWLLSEFQDPEMAAKPGDIVDSTRVVRDLCTAALERAKGEA